MKWMEIIRVRGSMDAANASIPLFKNMGVFLGDVAGLASWTVMKHKQYPGDAAVVLMWDNDREPVRTREGIAFQEAGNSHGSVEHSVWEVVSCSQGNLAVCRDAEKGG